MEPTAEWTPAPGMTLEELTRGDRVRVLRKVKDDPPMWAVEGTLEGCTWEAFIQEYVLVECFRPVEGEPCVGGTPSGSSP